MTRFFSEGAPAEPVGKLSDGHQPRRRVELARDVLERDRIEHGTILLASDLEIFPDDGPRLTAALAELRAAGHDLRILPLGAREEQKRFFESIIGKDVFIELDEATAVAAGRLGRPGRLGRLVEENMPWLFAGLALALALLLAVNERHLRAPWPAGAREGRGMTRRRVIGVAAVLALVALGRARRARSRRAALAAGAGGPGRALPRRSEPVSLLGSVGPASARRRRGRARRERRPRVPPAVAGLRPRPAASRFRRHQQRLGLRAETQLGLAGLSRTDPDLTRRARAANMIGVLALDESLAPERPRGARRSDQRRDQLLPERGRDRPCQHGREAQPRAGAPDREGGEPRRRRTLGRPEPGRERGSRPTRQRLLRWVRCRS